MGRSPSRREWLMRASAQLATRPSLTRNGSSAPTPGTGSTTPSSLSSEATRPPSTPKTVQYDCSPR